MAKRTGVRKLGSVADNGAAAAETVTTVALPQKVVKSLVEAFEGLGLTTYQARAIVALQQAGSASCFDLARLGSVNRTNIYQVLEELGAMGVAFRLPGPGPAVWGTVGRKEAVERLVDLEAERLQGLKARAARVTEMLEEAMPTQGSVSLSYVQVIHDPSRVATLYRQLLAETTDELMVFSRPPYSKRIGQAEPVILDTARRTTFRVLYQAAQAEDADYESWHHEMEEYHEAGVQARVVDELPIKLAVFDRQRTLLSLDDPVLPQIGFPITLLIEHPGYASIEAVAFDDMWATATPYTEIREQFEAYRRMA